MQDSEYFDQLRSIIALWIESRDERLGFLNTPDRTPHLLGLDTREWEEGMEESRKKTGKSREDFLTHLRLLMLFD